MVDMSTVIFIYMVFDDQQNNEERHKEKPPRRYGQATGSRHIDKRAKRILAETASEGPDDELLTTKQVSLWLTYSTQWLEIARVNGNGPKFERMGPKKVAYRRGDVRAWLRERQHQSTSEYKQKES
jgi:predicted DNA-binding transcriptional regulator AlpA